MNVDDERAGDAPVGGRPLCVREILSLYLRHSRARGLHSGEALADRERVFGAFAEYIAVGDRVKLGDLPAGEAKPYHLTDFVDSHPEWKSAATRRNNANMIRAAFSWAFDQERIDRHPFRRVRYPESERRPDMPDDVFERLGQLANKHFERAIRFLRLTGCRMSELCRATWDQFDVIRAVWAIPQHKSRKVTGKARVVVLVPEALEMFLALSRARRPGGSPYVFTNCRGTPWNRLTLGQTLRRLKRRHGIDVKATLHGLRHRYGTCAVANGAPIKLVSAQLGHSTVVVTEKYYVDLNGELEALREAAKRAQPK
jgi:integrase/recombinase XerD